MSTIKSSAENLTLNADGANNDIKFQSNGSEVASIDQAGSLVLSGNLTSLGIDDNADATAMTIDASENVLVGKTTTALATVGLAFGASGFASLTRDGYEPLNVNRLSSDGNVISVYKDSVVKGSIAVTGSGIGIQLGGTGAANTLDDYETGTFTPTFIGDTNPSVSYHEKEGSYTKIGNRVYITIWMRTASVSNTGTSTLYIGGLPFNVKSGNSQKGGISKGHIQNWGTIPQNLFFYANSNSIYIWDETNGTTHKTNILANGSDKNQISLEGFYEVS